MRCLDALRMRNAGTPPQAVKDKAITLIRKECAGDPTHISGAGMSLTTSDNAGATEIGIALVPPFYGIASGAITKQLICVGDDANWEVREWAASALAAHIGLSRTKLWMTASFGSS